jgi:glucose/arabinose dehydrogenase
MRLAMTIVAAMGLACPALAQEAFPNPLAESIGKGTVRVELQLLAEGLNSPMWAVGAGDGSGRLYVADQAGLIRVIDQGKLKSEPWLDVKSRLVTLRPNFDERGLLGLAFHPDFGKKGSPGFGKFYTYTSENIAGEAQYKLVIVGKFEGKDVPLPPDHHSVLAEWTVKADGSVDLASRREVMRFEEPQFNHNGGAIAFDDKGLLFIATGDGGQGNDYGPGHTEPGGNAQDTSKILGKMLRIDPLGKMGRKAGNGQYSIPDDNPFGAGGGAPEIYAWGLRNPFRICFDAPSGKLVTGDIGQEHIEEINVVVKGGNYGWRIKEGTFYFDNLAPKAKNIFKTTSRTDVPPTLIDPVAQYDHDDGISIIGGFVYRGRAITGLQGLYVFGEWMQPIPNKKGREPNGRLFHCDLTTGKMHEFLLGQDDRKLQQFVTGFGQDDAGELYLLTNTHAGPVGDGGKVWKIVPAK